MKAMYYFAYGSNMLRERLIDRGVKLLCEGRPSCADNYKLLFNKKSKDGSCKANLVDEHGAKCWGVLFNVKPDSLDALDAAEGAPDHYERQEVTVRVGDDLLTAVTYIAVRDKVLAVPGVPYDWYLALILAGANACAGMPAEWISALRQITDSKPDTKKPTRQTYTNAINQLKAAGYHEWRDVLTAP